MQLYGGMLMEQTKRGRGKGSKPAMPLVNLRLTEEVLAFYKRWPNYSKIMRTVLTNYAESQKS
jgi:uncharacterized protein (DUF4415 family)